MTKNKFILICFTIVILAAVIFYNNSESIINYFQNKEWEIADSIGSVLVNNYIDMSGTMSNLIVVGSNYIKGYSDDVKESFDLFMPFTDVVLDSNGDYCIVGEKNGTNIYMISRK